MKVIAHHTMVIQPEAKALVVPIDQAQEGVAVLVIEENGLAVVASVHQMVASLFGPTGCGVACAP
jgi:hypothetical protein